MKRLLVVVDYQNDFIDGALGFSGADNIEGSIIELIKEFESKDEDIVFTVDTHLSDYMDTNEGANLPVPHCIKGSDGWKIRNSLTPYIKDNKVFEKHTFGSSELGLFIKEKNYDEIVLCGLVSDICVATNALIAKSFAGPCAKIRIVRSATSSFDLGMQEKTFDVLKHLHIIIE
jgi:nicotinamidase-related amidase